MVATFWLSSPHPDHPLGIFINIISIKTSNPKCYPGNHVYLILGSTIARRMSDSRVPMIVRIPSISTINPAVYTSCWIMEFSKTGPRVGRLKTTETITLPLTRVGNR